MGIQAIFSDKTGTLTENQMIFRAASVNGINYEHAANSLIVSKTKSQTEVTDDETQIGGKSKRRPKSAHFRKITEDQITKSRSPEPSELENYNPETNVFP